MYRVLLMSPWNKLTDKPLKESVMLNFVHSQLFSCLKVGCGYWGHETGEYWALSLATYSGLMRVMAATHDMVDAISTWLCFLPALSGEGTCALFIIYYEFTNKI